MENEPELAPVVTSAAVPDTDSVDIETADFVAGFSGSSHVEGPSRFWAPGLTGYAFAGRFSTFFAGRRVTYEGGVPYEAGLHTLSQSLDLIPRVKPFQLEQEIVITPIEDVRDNPLSFPSAGVMVIWGVKKTGKSLFVKYLSKRLKIPVINVADASSEPRYTWVQDHPAVWSILFSDIWIDACRTQGGFITDSVSSLLSMAGNAGEGGMSRGIAHFLSTCDGFLKSRKVLAILTANAMIRVGSPGFATAMELIEGTSAGVYCLQELAFSKGVPRITFVQTIRPSEREYETRTVDLD